MKAYWKQLNIFSKITIVFILVAGLALSSINRNLRKDDGLIIWDIISYYAYLPATFIYHDLSLEFVGKKQGDKLYRIWCNQTDFGKRRIKTSMGLAIMYSPAFFAGHLAAHLFGYNTGGYSLPYYIALEVLCFVFYCLNLFYFRKLLLLYFHQNIVNVISIGIFLGTTYFFYSTIEGLMPHLFLFFFFIHFVLKTIDYYKKPSIKTAAILGLLLGIMSLIRPTNVLVLIFFILFGIEKPGDGIKRIRLFLNHFHHYLLMGAVCIIVWIPQMIYWKYVSGKFLYFSYEGENFFWTDPKIFEGLFSFRKGLLLYNPVLIFAFIGIPMLFKYLKSMALPIIVFVFLNTYIILSWWCWWYGGSYGGRAFIESFVLLAFPLGVFLTYILEKKLFIKIPVIIVVSCSILLGSFHVMKYYYGSIHYDGMTKAAYFDSFWRFTPRGKTWQLFKQPDYKKAASGEYRGVD